MTIYDVTARLIRGLVIFYQVRWPAAIAFSLTFPSPSLWLVIGRRDQRAAAAANRVLQCSPWLTLKVTSRQATAIRTGAFSTVNGISFEAINKKNCNNSVRRKKFVSSQPLFTSGVHLCEGRWLACVPNSLFWRVLAGVIWNSVGLSCIIMGCGLQVPLHLLMCII